MTFIGESENGGPAWMTALGGCLVMALAVGVGRFILTPLLPAMMSEIGLSPADAGLIAASNYAGYLAGALIAASPIIGERRTVFLRGSVIASVLSTAAMSLSDNLAWLLALRFFAGIFSAFVLVIASGHVVERLTLAGRPGLTAVHFAGVGVGIALSATLVGIATPLGADWATLWAMGGLLALLLAAGAFLLLRDIRTAKRRSDAADTSFTLDRAIVLLTVAYAFFGFGYAITATFIVTIARDAALTHAVQMGIWFLVGITALPSVAFWTRMAARHGVMIAYGSATLLLAFGVAASVLVDGITGLALAALLLGGTLMGITALGLVAARRLRPHAQIRAIAFVTAGFGLGQMIGPAFAGWIADLSGGAGAEAFLLPSLTAAALLLVSAWMAFRLPLPEK
ncbi:MAG: YbfB/YjiJ family MFS transporter [Geminicoccaceae bacterium]